MIREVGSFAELVATPFGDGINAVCWRRPLVGDFGEIVARLGGGEGIVSVDETRLRALHLGAEGRAAVEFVLEDLRLLRTHGFTPELNCIHGYPRDEGADGLPTDVYSFHADRAPIPSETWLCTYYGAPSEGVANDEARRRIDVPPLRAELLRRCGGDDDEAFAVWLEENCHDLHYVPSENARPFSFGVGTLWRIAVQHPGSPVPPCIHRAPSTAPDATRLLLIS